MAKGKKKRKKRRSAKQRANDKKLGRMAKRRAKPRRRKAPKRRTKPKKRKKAKKNKSTKPRKKTMAKGLGGIKRSLNSPILKKVLMASGLVTIATAVASIILPNQAQLINSPVVKAGLGFVVGDIPGAVTNFLLAGGVGNLSGGGSNGASSAGNSGFA